MKNKIISFYGALLLSFIILKLCDKINWSWLWVLCPVWIPIVIFIIYVLVKLWQNRGTVPCSGCKYGNSEYNVIFGRRYYCRKDKYYHNDGYRCEKGEWKD